MDKNDRPMAAIVVRPFLAMKKEVQCLTVTAERHDFADITDDVAEAVSSSGVVDGHITLGVSSSDCALIVNERESGLIEDLKRTLDRLGPDTQIGSSSIVLPAVGGELRLGTWQRILLIERGSGGDRTVSIHIEGE